ncbi:porin family protein [Dysgonomonas termitidis]|uniref:Porin family protein n=1 Tax=Dysgonomonas termitidis TaxID=1516126 RepID=A0ABV9L2I0_9BACT
MKQKIKITLAAIFLIGGLSVSAQEKKFFFGAKAGFVFSDLSEYSYKTRMKHSFTGGLTFDYFLNRDLYISSAIEFANKGAKFDLLNKNEEEGTSLDIKNSTIAAFYIQVPVHLGYKFDLSEKTRLMVQAGPYIAYGVGGPTELGDEVILKTPGETITMNLNEYMRHLPYYNLINDWRRDKETFSDTHFREFDWGIGIGMGVEYEHVNISFRYDFGLYNISQEAGKVKNRNASVTLGYKF